MSELVPKGSNSESRQAYASICLPALDSVSAWLRINTIKCVKQNFDLLNYLIEEADGQPPVLDCLGSFILYPNSFGKGLNINLLTVKLSTSNQS